jgi:hypothetical protein
VSWKFGVSLVAIVAVYAFAFFAQIASIGGSDSCNGCDTTPSWVNPTYVGAGIALGLWVAALLIVLVRRD